MISEIGLTNVNSAHFDEAPINGVDADPAIAEPAPRNSLSTLSVPLSGAQTNEKV